MLLAITAATADAHPGPGPARGTSHPYQQTRAATSGPDEVAYLGRPPDRAPRAAPAPGRAPRSRSRPRPGRWPAPGGDRLERALPARGRPVSGQRPDRRGRGRRPRPGAPATVDQPKLTAGSWVRPGGVVLSSGPSPQALGVGAGDRITLNGRPFTVTGIAVTAANPPYPNLCYLLPAAAAGRAARQRPGRDMGLLWLTKPDALAWPGPTPVTTSRAGPEAEEPGHGGRVRPAYDRHTQRPFRRASPRGRASPPPTPCWCRTSSMCWARGPGWPRCSPSPAWPCWPAAG